MENQPHNNPYQGEPKPPHDYQAPPPKPAGISAGWIVAMVLGGVLVVSALMCLLLAALLVPAIQSARQAAGRAQSLNNLRMIGVAMHQYHALHGTFPPAYTLDEKERRVASWRTLILPYLEQQGLYDMIDTDKLWDDPTNARARNVELSIFRSPRDDGSDPFMTNYLAITGEGAMLPGAAPTNMADIRDGTSNTIMVVEVFNSDIEWSEPRDLNIDDIRRVQDGADPDAINVIPEGGAVLFGDGSVRLLKESVTREMFQQYLTRDAGDMPQRWPEY